LFEENSNFGNMAFTVAGSRFAAAFWRTLSARLTLRSGRILADVGVVVMVPLLSCQLLLCQIRIHDRFLVFEWFGARENRREVHEQ
jgi:hypothetical protein